MWGLSYDKDMVIEYIYYRSLGILYTMKYKSWKEWEWNYKLRLRQFNKNVKSLQKWKRNKNGQSGLPRKRAIQSKVGELRWQKKLYSIAQKKKKK